MSFLIATRGLPGSGKSTWAERTAKHTPYLTIVNKDNIRKKLVATGWTWSKEREKDVIAERDRLIVEALSNGISVISSDTNFGNHIKRLQDIAFRKGATFSVKDFTHVPLETCIERDSKRTEGKVGEEVIRTMYNKYIKPQDAEPYTPKPGTPPAIICDLDGTLAIFKGLRGPYDYAKCAKDRINPPILSIIRLFSEQNYAIVYCSGREDSARFPTEDFLATNGCPKGPLFMRASGDHRKDYIVKQELFDQHIRDNYNVKFVLDDRDQVVQMWRRLGLTCLQVADGAF